MKSVLRITLFAHYLQICDPQKVGAGDCEFSSTQTISAVEKILYRQKVTGEGGC